MNFIDVPKKYRPIPFWSWNDKLIPKETAEQIRIMDNVGIGGFFMHARGGLKTEYLSDEWFENVETSIKTAKECGMYPWAYDENGWPSGFGSGKVNELGVEYQQKYLRISEIEPQENIIAKCGKHWFYYEINPFYVDVLDKKVISKFIEVAYEPYFKRFGNDFEGFFTDEPQISRNGIPWSFTFDDEFNKRYKQNLNDCLEELFLPVGDYKNTRVKFWKMVTDLFSDSFMKQIYDWCTKRNLKFTGHMVLEENMLEQITSNGAVMPHYEYLTIPGMDWLGRNIFDCLTPKGVSSVAEQLGKEQVLSETFALCGHNVSFAELKGIYEWQMVHGINLLCQHLEGYSIAGIRKRDYPPAMYKQQPWWCEYDKLVDGLSRESMILAKGKKSANILLLHPQTTAWSLFDNKENKGIMELNDSFISDMKRLENKHLLYHLGDETIIERHAKVENGMLVIGEQKYSIIVNSRCEILLDTTKQILDEFVKQGGKIYNDISDLPYDDIVDNKEITYTKREFDNFTAHYFVNTSAVRKNSYINVDGKKLDIYSGELENFCSNYEFEPWGSLLVIEDGTKNICDNNEEITLIKPAKTAYFEKPCINTLTLDKCDYYFDGILQEKNGYVLNVCERANALKKSVHIHQDYKIEIKNIPNKLEMAVENPEIYKIYVNGEEIENNITGYFADKSFKKIDILKNLKIGENIISFDFNFYQSEEFYKNYENSKIFESEKNKLVYNMEIEPIYLIGEFSVLTDGEWKILDRNASRYSGDFVIDAPKEKILLHNIEKQGYPFFCGEMELVGEIDIQGSRPVLELDIKGINIVKVEINGIEKVILTDNRLSLSEFNVVGKNKIKLTLVNNLRNLLGPHHLKIGESFEVCPHSFYKEPCVWNQSPEKDWDDDYCFVNTGIL